MKKFAYYLPQFHTIPENDEWWGKGFTEWTNVKKAKPLYRGHKQPNVPLNDNYYVLDNVDVLKWQAGVAEKYNIDGMIFYHYYFRGKKLLEKPIELLLQHKDIPMNFFFCWANHSWYRSWEGSKELLLKQEYGLEKDWEIHFQYLIKFFLDERYEKINNKPLLLIYDNTFEEKKRLLEYFNRRCIDYGFSGICTIEQCNGYSNEQVSKSLEQTYKTSEFIAIREPAECRIEYIHNTKYILSRIRKKLGKIMDFNRQHFVEKYDGNKMYDIMIEKFPNNKTVIPGLFFEWDNTPRHSYRGYVITPPSKEKFMEYMDTIKESEYVFINAWNEWCEGMMLEPTKSNGYKYLEWLKEWSENNENWTNGI